MADSLCGPSNPLQSLQKQSTIDRTIQQDRLVAKQSSSHGFRSAPGPHAGHLDPEFMAFQAAQPHFNPQVAGPSAPLHYQSPHLPSQQSLQQQSELSGWASDFQRLRLSDSQSHPSPQAQFQSPAQHRQDTGGWHQEFASQFQGSEQRGVMQSGPMPNQALSSQFSPISQGMGLGMGMPQYGGGMMGQTGVAQQTLPEDVYDDAAFAKAFEEVSRAEMERFEEESKQEQEAETQHREVGQDVLLDESAERFMSDDQPQIPDQERIGSDLIEDPRLDPDARGEDHDALSRTAGHLLSSVSNNTSSKFANSEFLSFMRQLRDKEVKVVNETIVNTRDLGAEAQALGQPHMH